MNMTEEHVKRVGPIIRGVDGELCDAVINAIEDDNPGADVEVDDQGGYVKITAPWHCRLTLASLGIAEGEWCYLEQEQLDLLVAP